MGVSIAISWSRRGEAGDDDAAELMAMGRATALTRELASGVLGLLYPPHCYLCGVPLEESFVCPDCYRRLPRPQPPWCARCGAPVEEPEVDLCLECATRPWFFDRARSFGFYAGGLAELIRGLKYGGERALAWELARYLLQAGDELLPRIEALTFVPMSRPKLRERGFNQAELLAQELGKLADLPPVSALVKVRQTEDQTGLGPGERFKNISGAFAPYGKTSLQRGLLIDDVYTTGATAEECARALLEGGFQEVYVLTVARSRPRVPKFKVPGSRFRNLELANLEPGTDLLRGAVQGG